MLFHNWRDLKKRTQTDTTCLKLRNGFCVDHVVKSLWIEHERQLQVFKPSDLTDTISKKKREAPRWRPSSTALLQHEQQTIARGPVLHMLFCVWTASLRSCFMALAKSTASRSLTGKLIVTLSPHSSPVIKVLDIYWTQKSSSCFWESESCWNPCAFICLWHCTHHQESSHCKATNLDEIQLSTPRLPWCSSGSFSWHCSGTVLFSSCCASAPGFPTNRSVFSLLPGFMFP